MSNSQFNSPRADNLPDLNELGPSKRHITLGGGGVGLHSLNKDYSFNTLYASGKLDSDRKQHFGRKNQKLRNSYNIRESEMSPSSPISLMNPSPISRSRILNRPE